MAGGLAGSTLATRLRSRFGAPVLLRTGLLVEVGLQVVLGTTREPLVAGAALAVWGVHAMVWGVLVVSLRQRLVPDRLRGRVNGAYALADLGGAALGTVAGGLLATATGSILQPPLHPVRASPMPPPRRSAGPPGRCADQHAACHRTQDGPDAARVPTALTPATPFELISETTRGVGARPRREHESLTASARKAP
ncbi:hypothetical protein GCM10022379_56980 [Micromonospora maritima]